MQLQRRPALRKFMGRNGREYIVRHLSRQRTAIEYENVLNAAVRGKTLAVESTAA
jgi:glycosyltransferase involved in cell wall biosynthesis